jgi:hypothetical protein
MNNPTLSITLRFKTYKIGAVLGALPFCSLLTKDLELRYQLHFTVNYQRPILSKYHVNLPSLGLNYHGILWHLGAKVIQMPYLFTVVLTFSKIKILQKINVVLDTINPQQA